MDNNKILNVKNRKEWRKWLNTNFNKEKEIWLTYPKKQSGKTRILYNDAVEEALCFGWIDSTIKALDEDNLVQKFSPRNPNSTYSQANKERIRWLYSRNLIHKSIKESIKKILIEDFIFPIDIIEEIKNDKIVWSNYEKYSDSYKRIRIAYIDSARNRPIEFKKRLLNFIEKTRKNKIIGYGGIEKYY